MKLFTFKVRRRLLTYLWQLQCQIMPEKVAKFSLADGSRFDYPLKSAIGGALFTGGFEIEEVKYVRHSLKPGDVFLDVGANGGLFTVIAAKLVGDKGQVYAFEPGEREIKLLRHNIKINNLKNVTVIERAVSNKSTTTKFAVSQDGALNSLAKTNHPKQKIEEWKTVITTTVDEIVEELKIAKINFIKIDVEGAEKLVFEGAKKALSSNNKLLVLFESANVNTSGFDYFAKDLLAELRTSGFHIYYLADNQILLINRCDESDIENKFYNFIATNKIIGLNSREK